MNKPKILICSESSKISSGFGVYNKYLINGLFQTNKYEIAEFASYGLIGDREKFKIPWKYYPNCVEGNDPRQQIYNSSVENHFGKWRFDRVVLDFKPDIVIDVRDYWMSSYQAKSPLRKYFHWILMPTVDSSPQQEEWLDTYLNADAIFTYSDWGAEVLKEQTSNRINYIDTVSPSFDHDVFKTRQMDDIETLKRNLGLPTDSIVIGTVMRNQKRKLFPELIRTFEKVIEELEQSNPYKATRTYLYLHTSYPDAGWDFANLVKESKVGNRIRFTYACRSCGATVAYPFSGVLQTCSYCKNQSMVMPNVSNGVDNDILGKIMNCFDIYIQYAICEGFGMPQIEAAGCGVPVVTTNYSAMVDMIKKIDAIPVDIGAYFKELETGAIRTYPNENNTKEAILKLINYTDGMRRKIGYDMHKKASEQYGWDKTVQKWDNYLSKYSESFVSKWSKPPVFLNKIEKNDIPSVPLVFDKISIIYNQKNLHHLGLKMSDYWILKQIQTAENGVQYSGNEQKPFTVENIIKNLNTMIDNYNITERARVDPSILDDEDYINYANNK